MIGFNIQHFSESAAFQKVVELTPDLVPKIGDGSGCDDGLYHLRTARADCTH